MYEHKSIIDNEGYLVEECVLLFNNEIQYFKLQEGQQIIDRYKGSYIKPKLVNNEWVETATDEETEEYKKNVNLI